MGICDSHVRVVGDPAIDPQVADRTYTAAAAPLAPLLRAAQPLGVTRFVVVQPSFYGTDNSVTLHAIAALGGNGHAGAARCVWGSDWPHTAPYGKQKGDGVALPCRALAYPDVLEGARAALPAAQVDAILRSNPARLYGFARA